MVAGQKFQGYQAFRYCDSLESVTAIGTYAFAGCRSLTSVTLKGSGTYLKMDHGSVFAYSPLATIPELSVNNTAPAAGTYGGFWDNDLFYAIDSGRVTAILQQR